MTQSEDPILQAARILRDARHLVAFTGAGMSVPSGIPDFRSQGSGQWTRFDPLQVASLSAFRRHPDRLFDWLRPLARDMRVAQPNPAHLALARLEAGGILKAIITQNIDALHQRAGSKIVLELHGSLDTFLCPRCGMSTPAAEHWNRLIDENTTPRCSRDGAILKPGIILYEEALPEDIWRAAEAHALQADAMLVIGSSLEVSPANLLPAYAVWNSAALIINTRSTTHLDPRATLLLRGDIAEVIPAIVQAVLAEAG